jgi:hypothetical protein
VLSLPFNSLSQNVGWQAGLYLSLIILNSGTQGSDPSNNGWSKVAPGMSVSYDSVHTIAAGVNMLHEYGSNKVIGDLSPTAYYMFRKNHIASLPEHFREIWHLKDIPGFFSGIR